MDISDEQERFIEDMGLQFEADGMPRISGRIFGLLMLSTEERSLDDMAAALSVSRASISTDARRLDQCGLVERVTRKGDRKDYYRIAPNHYARALEQHIGSIQRMLHVFGRGRSMDGVSPEVQTRIDLWTQGFRRIVALLEKEAKDWAVDSQKFIPLATLALFLSRRVLA